MSTFLESCEMCILASSLMTVELLKKHITVHIQTICTFELLCNLPKTDTTGFQVSWIIKMKLPPLLFPKVAEGDSFLLSQVVAFRELCCKFVKLRSMNTGHADNIPQTITIMLHVSWSGGSVYSLLFASHQCLY